MSKPTLPAELADIVLDHLHADKPTLSSCATVCKAWLPTAQYHLFSDMRVHLSYDILLAEFLASLITTPKHLIKMIRKLTLYGHPAGTGMGEVPLAYVDAKLIQILLEALPSLQTLKLEEIEIEDSIEEFDTYCSPIRWKLRHLELLGVVAYSLSIYQRGWTQLLSLFSDIHTLDVSFHGTPCDFFDLRKILPRESTLKVHTFNLWNAGRMWLTLNVFDRLLDVSALCSLFANVKTVGEIERLSVMLRQASNLERFQFNVGLHSKDVLGHVDLDLSSCQKLDTLIFKLSAFESGVCCVATCLRFTIDLLMNHLSLHTLTLSRLEFHVNAVGVHLIDLISELTSFPLWPDLDEHLVGGRYPGLKHVYFFIILDSSFLASSMSPSFSTLESQWLENSLRTVFSGLKQSMGAGVLHFLTVP